MSIINPYKAYQYFKDNFVLSRPSPKKWYAFNCPFCGKEKKMAVHFSRDQAKCWSCGADGTIIDFVMEVEKVDYYKAKEILWSVRPSSIKLDLLEEEQDSLKVRTSSGYLPFGYKSLMDGDTSLARRARNYLEGRGFDCKQLDASGFGYVNKHDKNKKEEDYFGYIIIPYKKSGKLVYYIGRDFIGNFLRYKNPTNDVFGVGKSDVIFNEDALGVYDTVFMFEGALDALTMGGKATATSGWALSKYQLNKYFSSKVKKLVFVPDGGADNTGQTFYQKAVKQASVFIDSHIVPYVVDLNIPEFAVLGKDANDIGKNNILKKYKNDTAPLTWSATMEILTS